MGVIKLPESFQHLLMSPELEDVFKAMGLDEISQMPLNGVDIRRVYKMLENVKAGGATKIRDLLGRVTALTLTEEIVAEALQLPITNYPVKARRSHADLAEIFENPKKTGNTYAQNEEPNNGRPHLNHTKYVQAGQAAEAHSA